METAMQKDTLSLVLVGHIDHGKSTLIGRLLYDTNSLPEGKFEEVQAAAHAEGRELEFGYIMDHLHEERARGITIDTAQTFFSSPTRDYVIIDAPGHKEFIKNMITGASQAEAAVLICSVFEGVQEQTKRHAYVIKMLGVGQVIVAYNKMDLVDYSEEKFRQVKADMDAFLARLDVKPSVEVPISAHLGDNVAAQSENMPWYSGPSIVEALDVFQKVPSPVEKPLRFPVQDIYEQDDLRIVAGRVESGTLKTGQSVRFFPGARNAEVTRILDYAEEDPTSARAGQCIGVLTGGYDPQRGEVACADGDNPQLTDRFQASVFWLSPEALELDDADGLVFKCATQEKQCRIETLHRRIDSGSLEPLSTEEGRLEETEVGEATVVTDGPVVLESFYDVQELGRFVLMKGLQVVAGGIVTHPS